MKARIETVIYETPGQVCKAKAQELCRMILDFAKGNPDVVPTSEEERKNQETFSMLEGRNG